MVNRFTPPELGPPDAEGFETFRLYDHDIGETTRVGLHFEKLRDYVAKTASNTDLYSPLEVERLQLAAAIIAAREEFPEHDREGALKAIFEVSPDIAADVFRKYYPSLIRFGIIAASDICVKHTLNLMVQGLRAPRIYDDLMLREIFREFIDASSFLLGIGPGRPEDTAEHITKVKEALETLSSTGELRLRNGKPTQTQIAGHLNMAPRGLRKWHEVLGLTWTEYLRACGWTEKPEYN